MAFMECVLALALKCPNTTIFPLFLRQQQPELQTNDFVCCNNGCSPHHFRCSVFINQRVPFDFLVFLSSSFFPRKKKKDQRSLYITILSSNMQIKKLVSMYSRTGRDLQRYNFEGCRQVVGCITYRFKKNHKAPSVHGTLINELEFLLISSQKSPRMMFPKGGWELDETIEDAANRETMEEAGVLGVVGKKLGVWTFKSKSQDTFHEGHMLSFKVTEELNCWPEKDVRTRVWLSAEEARKICVHEWMKEALDRFVLQLDEDEDESLCGRLSISEEEEEVSCAITHFHRKEEECRIHLFTMHLPRSPCSTEKSRISRVSQAGEEDVALLVN